MYLGIEIGGTKLQLGLGDGLGAIHALWRGVVVPTNGADGIRQQIVTAIPDLLANAKRERAELQGVGIGFGGPVDDATRTVIKSHQIQGWDDFPLADWIADLVGIPAVLGNDADVAGLAEALFGAGKGLSPIFYITLGSGIGGGLILNGEIYRGCGRGAAEMGHLRVSVSDLTKPGDAETAMPLEQIASGWAIERLFRDQLRLNPHSLYALLQHCGGHSAPVSMQGIGEILKTGDRETRTLFELPLACLADGLCHVIALLCPRRIVIGGGVSLLGNEVLFTPLRRLVAERTFKPFADCYDIVPAELGEEVVIHGSLALARRRIS
jgi:glucokinase